MVPAATAIAPRTAAGPRVPAGSPRTTALSMLIAQWPGEAGATCWAMDGIMLSGTSAPPRVPITYGANVGEHGELAMVVHQGGEQ